MCQYELVLTSQVQRSVFDRRKKQDYLFLSSILTTHTHTQWFVRMPFRSDILKPSSSPPVSFFPLCITAFSGIICLVPDIYIHTYTSICHFAYATAQQREEHGFIYTVNLF